MANAWSPRLAGLLSEGVGAVAPLLPLYEAAERALNGLGEHELAAHFYTVRLATESLIAAARECVADALIYLAAPSGPPEGS